MRHSGPSRSLSWHHARHLCELRPQHLGNFLLPFVEISYSGNLTSVKTFIVKISLMEAAPSRLFVPHPSFSLCTPGLDCSQQYLPVSY